MSFSSQRQQLTLGQWLYQGFLKFFIYPSFWVSAGLASLTYFTQETLGLNHDWQPLIFIFFAALIPYNLDRIFDSYVQTIPDPQAQSYFRHRGIFILPVVAAVGLAILLYNAPPEVRLVSCGGIAPLIYRIPLLPLGRGKKALVLTQGYTWHQSLDCCSNRHLCRDRRPSCLRGPKT